MAVALRPLVHLGLSSDGLKRAVSLASNTAQQHLKKQSPTEIGVTLLTSLLAQPLLEKILSGTSQ